MSHQHHLTLQPTRRLSELTCNTHGLNPYPFWLKSVTYKSCTSDNETEPPKGVDMPRKKTLPPAAVGGVDELIKLYGRPSFSASSQQSAEIDKLVAYLHSSMKHRCRDFVMGRMPLPMMQFYSNDGTPIKTRVKGSWKVGTQTIRREGKKGKEFLVQMTFFRYLDDDGTPHTVCSWQPPLPLDFKTGAAIYAATLQHHQSLREQGHMGLVVDHYSFDRALFGPLSSFLIQEHMMVAPKYGANAAESDFLHLQEWVTTVGCALHDAHNSLKWGLNFHALGPQLLKDIHIVMQSLKNSFDLITERLSPWLICKVAPTSRADCVPDAQLHRQWAALGVDPVLIEQLVTEMALHWDFNSGLLRVDSEWLKRDNSFEEITGVMMGLWDFHPFSDSRWVTVGHSCRTLVVGLISGLPSLIEDIREHCKHKLFYIEGFQRLQEGQTRFAVVASMAAYVPDAGLSMMFEDPRVAKNAEPMNEAMVGELRWLHTLEDDFWLTLGRVFGANSQVTAYVLRSDVITSAHIAFAFFDYRVVSAVTQYPWTIAVGNQDKNLDDLKASPMPEEATARKIWKLLQIGYSRETIKAGLDLLLDAPWGTSVTEQAHAMAAVVKRMHAEIGAGSLLTRAFVGGFRKILPSQTAEERQLSAQKKKLASLITNLPARTGGRQMFFGDMVRLSQERSIDRSVLGKERAELIMKKHGDLFNRLSPAQKMDYEYAAASSQSASTEALISAKAEAVGRVGLAKLRVEQSRASCPSLSLRSCQLSEGEVSELSAGWGGCTLTPTEVKGVIAGWRQAPEPISDAHKDALAQYAAPLCTRVRNPDATKPVWMGSVVASRDDFADTVWAVFQGDNVAYYRFLFGMQTPQHIAFEPLKKLDVSDGLDDGLAPESHDGGPEVSAWLIDVGVVKDWSQLGLADADLVMVSRYARSIGDFVVTCADQAVEIGEFLTGVHVGPAAKEPPKKKAKAKAGPSITPEMLAMYPWLASDTKAKASKSFGGAASSSSGVPADEDVLADAVAVETLDDDGLEALYAELEKKREEWAVHTSEDVADAMFKVTVLKGKWTFEKTGMAYDAVRAFASAPVREWCRKYSLQDAKRWNVLLYGEAETFTIAKAWCSKMAYLYNIWMSQGSEDYEFTAAEVDAWPVPKEYSDLLPTLNKKQSEGKSVSMMRPKLA